jgi:glycosyltransferase involved in cell wall biosynthesis
MPVFNHAQYIGEMLKCLFNQTDQNFEVLITDDGSTDDLRSSLKEFKDPRISFFRSEKNEGMMNAANHMLKIAKGDFFVLLSADDTMDDDFLEKCRREFQKDPFLEYVASQNDFMAEDGSPYNGIHPLMQIEKAANKTQDEWRNRLYGGNVYFGIGMYRTSALREVGGWNPDCGVISDYEMYLKLLPRYNFRIIEENLTHTRIHGKNQSLLGPQEAGKLRKRYYDAQKPYYKPIPKIIIATPFYELKGFSPYIRSLTDITRILTLHNINWEFMELSGDSYVHRARNSMCMNFLDDPYATDLFFIDSDMAWDAQSFMTILFRPEPIIGGTYPVKNKWDAWTSKAKMSEENGQQHFTGIPLPDGSALIEANQLAGGFLRIKRSVLEKFVEAYPTAVYYDTHPDPNLRRNQVEFFTAGMSRELEIDLCNDIEKAMNENGGVVDMTPFKERFAALKNPRDFIGEDYWFSNRLRKMGITLFIYPNATISHFGVNGWTGNFNTFLREKQAESRKAA